jgi:hypothetical protein
MLVAILFVLNKSILLDEHETIFSADAFQGSIDNDPAHPPFQGAFVSVLLQFLKDLDEAFLKDVFGFVFIVGISQSNAIEPAGIHLIEPGLCPWVAPETSF